MRVTNNMWINSFVVSLMKNTQRLQETQNSISSGRKVNKSSDDPVGSFQILHHRSTISSLEQFSRNIQEGISFMNATDTALRELENFLIRAKELAVSQASETNDAAIRKAASKEVQAIFDHILTLGNTKFGNKYIFGGYKTNLAPFSSDGSYNGDNGEISVRTGESSLVPINIRGDIVFKGSGGGVDVFNILSQFKNALENNDPNTIRASIDVLDKAQNQAIETISLAGSRLNQLESTREILSNTRVNIETILSEKEDVDIAKAATDLIVLQNAIEASLSSAPKVILPSLMDFLR